MMADPFEVRMRFTAQLQHLNASVASSQKAAHYALKYRDMDEDLHSCILEQLERNNMNNRANILYFIEQFCEMATKENHLQYVRMIQRDIFRVVDSVAPADGSGAANVKHVRRVLNGLQNKEVLSAETVAEFDAALKERETHPAHLDLEAEEEEETGSKSKTGTPRGSRANGIRVDKRQIEQRIEEDRERNKRLRESMWTVRGDDTDEHRKFWDETSDIGEDDFTAAHEELMERSEMLVTAAKGILFAEQNPNNSSNIAAPEPGNTATATNSKMVTTRRSAAHVAIPTEDAGLNGSLELNGKRKSDNTASETPEAKGNKRRKRSNIQVVEQEVTHDKEDAKEEAAPKKHFRFDSEEPVLPEPTETEEPIDAQQGDQDEEESSDDEAPETVDNSAQLSKIKSEARKQEKARQIEEQLKREKRRQLDEARKQQAKASSKRKETSAFQAAPGSGTSADDIVSESSETLQGSYTQDYRRPTLPALLPDDILNAVPEVRPPTPPPETQTLSQKKPTKLRFLEKKEKAPKDVRMGDVAIRVLDGGGSQKQPSTALPPKASKTGRNSKEAWLKQARSTGHVNGMRMASSGSKGFVRK